MTRALDLQGLTSDRATVQSHSQAPDLRLHNSNHPRNHLFLQLLCKDRQELRICKQFEVLSFNLSTQAHCDISSLKLEP
ncbi:hypothetical protein NL676_010714 [Syzygium grande]|nr:hypothetical protein NL676_010714 [Syzygium grande]